MRALVVYCHPNPKSFNAAIRDAVLEVLKENGNEARLIDLYERGFNPVMSESDLIAYNDETTNLIPFRDQADDLLWAETVIFIYPTWWFNVPAMLKGWLERVLVPGFAFEMPTAERDHLPKLTNIRRIVVLTTCGATPWLSWLVGQPGRRTLLRGFRGVCHPLSRTKYIAIYKMDSSTDAQRRKHLQRIKNTVRRLG
jgi:NAD(P)H dehydrogenase (quinone)